MTMISISTIEIGAPIRFRPSCFMAQKTDDGRGGANEYESGSDVTGRIVYIHRAHHWFRVAYQVRGETLHECFPLHVTLYGNRKTE